MDRRFGYSLFYVFLLLTITPAMCRRRAKRGHSESRSEKRQIQYAAALLPTLAEVAGATLAPWLFVALVAVYGITAVRNHSIQKDDVDEDKCNSHVCANDGWCREPCHSNEKPVWWLQDLCGGGCPCCVTPEKYRILNKNKGKK